MLFPVLHVRGKDRPELRVKPHVRVKPVYKPANHGGGEFPPRPGDLGCGCSMDHLTKDGY